MSEGNPRPSNRGAFCRRRFLNLAAGALAAPAVSRRAWAQDYPSRPVRVIVGFPPGLSADVIARLAAQELSERLGQQFVVENRPGASTNIATEAVVRAKPDGYTLLYVTVPNAINNSLYANLNFNFLRDIAPVAGVDRSSFVMVVDQTFPARTVPDFIAYAKANPGKINMASNGTGTVTHMAGALFMAMTGVDLVHVPYSGSFFSDLLSGKVQVAFSPLAGALGYIKNHTLYALAVTSPTRAALLPDVAAMAEFVPGYEATLWDGIGAPKDTPADIISKLNTAVNAVLTDPRMTTRLTGIGSVAMPMSPSGFGKLVSDETEKWSKVIRSAHIKIQ
jgi:tripartite-type tricarboxylate transporter receptor subunit TctC